MDTERLKIPVTSKLPGSGILSGIPEVTDINYDLLLLRITLQFENRAHPVYVDFEGVRGFRVLDEGDLLEFWRPGTRSEGWLWRVSEGGWLDLENLREGFTSRVTGECQEFLIAGVNDCVNVLAADEPRINASEP